VKSQKIAHFGGRKNCDGRLVTIPILTMLRRNSKLAKIERPGFVLKFPVLELLQLPLIEILRIREDAPFKVLRKELAALRKQFADGGKGLPLSRELDRADIKMKESFLAAGEYLYEYLMKGEIERMILRKKSKYVLIRRVLDTSYLTLTAIAADVTAMQAVESDHSGWKDWIKLSALTIAPIIAYSLLR
jgi:hypothetical protein